MRDGLVDVERSSGSGRVLVKVVEKLCVEESELNSSRFAFITSRDGSSVAGGREVRRLGGLSLSRLVRWGRQALTCAKARHT